MTIGFAILPNNEVYNYIRGIQLRLNQELGIRIALRPQMFSKPLRSNKFIVLHKNFYL